MSDVRKRSTYNEHVQEMSERKQAVEENKRLDKILHPANKHHKPVRK